nr:uncharacterized protein LOC107392715 isoform X1 [Nothobranchius furzeri]XP_054608260.1 uncharacterized protein LOC107392715 isoform X1 [Nothobranchius furzeri]
MGLVRLAVEWSICTWTHQWGAGRRSNSSVYALYNDAPPLLKYTQEYGHTKESLLTYDRDLLLSIRSAMINLQNSDTGPAFPPPLEPGVNPGLGPLLPVGLPLPRRPWKRKRGKRAGFFVQLRKILRGEALPDRCSAAVLWRIQQKLNGVGLISLLNGAPDVGRYLKAWETKNHRGRSVESLRSLACQPPTIIEPAAHTPPDSSAKMMLTLAPSPTSLTSSTICSGPKNLTFCGFLSHGSAKMTSLISVSSVLKTALSSLLHEPQVAVEEQLLSLRNTFRAKLYPQTPTAHSR